MNPYYKDDQVQLFHGDMREVLPALELTADACVTDPPYGETSLGWDRWPEGWPALVAACTSSMWCFGSMRMFLDRRDQFTDVGWKLSQDAVGEFEIDTMVWEKNNGTGFAVDRLRRVHELAVHWYLGVWADRYHQPPRVPYDGPNNDRRSKRKQSPAHTGTIGPSGYHSAGTRLVRSVIHAASVRGGIHRTQKPVDLVTPMIEYAVPLGGLALDPFAGSGTTLLAARQVGRRAIGIEASEEYCEKAAERLSIPDLFSGTA